MNERTGSLQDLFGKTLDCACGRQHDIETQGMYYGKVAEVAQYVPQGSKVLVLCDANTQRVAGDAALDALRGAGFDTEMLCLAPKGELHANEWAVGETQRAAQGKGFILAVGTGTLGDVARYVSYKLGIPFGTLATAPSMDGFTSSVSPLLENGFKRTMLAHSPLFVFADPDILRDAPSLMSAAGVGDMAGKLTAKLDWKLAALTEGEYYCGQTADLMLEATGRSIASADGIAKGEGGAACDLMDGLVLSGLAMQMVGNSRPASGCEHHLAHFWEMRDMQRGLPERLHGERVGVATLLMLRLYQKFFEQLPAPREPKPLDAAEGQRVFGALWPEMLAEQEGAVYAPFAQERERLMGQMESFRKEVEETTAQGPVIRAAIQKLGGPVSPSDFGYDKQGVRESLLWCCYIRQRMTLLRLLLHWGVLEELVDQVVEEAFSG